MTRLDDVYLYLSNLKINIPIRQKQVEKQLNKEILQNKLDLFNELDFNL